MPLVRMIIVISMTIQALVGIETLVRVEILIEVMEEEVEDLLVIHQVVPLMEVLLEVIGEALDLLFLGKIMVTIVLEGQEVAVAQEAQVEEEVVVQEEVVVGVPLLPLQVVMATAGDS